jgi:hypothetical protein
MDDKRSEEEADEQWWSESDRVLTRQRGRRWKNIPKEKMLGLVRLTGAA